MYKLKSKYDRNTVTLLSSALYRLTKYAFERFMTGIAIFDITFQLKEGEQFFQ